MIPKLHEGEYALLESKKKVYYTGPGLKAHPITKIRKGMFTSLGYGIVLAVFSMFTTRFVEEMHFALPAKRLLGITIFPKINLKVVRTKMTKLCPKDFNENVAVQLGKELSKTFWWLMLSPWKNKGKVLKLPIGDEHCQRQTAWYITT